MAMACGPPPPDSWRLCVHTQPRHRARRSRLGRFAVCPLLAFLGALWTSRGVLAQPANSTNMATSSSSPPASSAPPVVPTNDTAALLASSDLTALFYRHYNSGVIVAPLVVANTTQLPTEVTSRIQPYELQFDQLDGFLQRALLWDAGYIYIPPATASSNASSNSSNSSRSLATATSPFLKVYTRDGVDMADIAPTRSEMETAGCALQLCTSEYGTTWRAVSCGDSSAILSVVHCAIDTRESAMAVATNSTDGRGRALWTAWNAEDRSSADSDALNKAELAAPDLNVAEYMTSSSSSGESRSSSSGAKLLTIHTVPFSEEPPIGQCPASRTDERGDLLPTLTIPCAAYDAVVGSPSTSSASRSLAETTAAAAGTSNEWKQPKSSQLLSSWLESVAPKSVAAGPTPGGGGGAKPTGSSTNNNGNSNSNSNSNNNNNSGAVPPGGGGAVVRENSDGGFNLLNLIPIVVGAMVIVAVVLGFVLLRKRSNSKREMARRGEDRGARDGCSPYANSSMFKTEDAYVDATSFLSPAAAVSVPGGDFTASGRSNLSHPQHLGDLDNEIHSSNNSAVSLETVRASSDRRRSAPKSLVMATLRRVISEPSSGSNPVSRPSLDTEHLKLLQTDPNLSASRLSYDKIVFERVISRSPRYEVWLSQYEGEEIAVKRLVQRANNDSLLALDNELSLAGAAAAMASDDRMANALEAFVAEIQITASLDHPNLARFVGVAWARLPADSLCLVTEYQSNGDLRTYIQKHREKLTWPRHKLKWAKGIANGLRYLHNQRPIVLHLELNSTHVLLSDRLKPKLVDFGERLSAEDWTQLRISGEESHLNQHLGFPYWAAPEVLRGDGHLMASDVYAFGMLLVELDACKVPFQDAKNTSGGGKLKPFQMMNMVVSGRLRPVMADSCPVEIREIIERCTDAVPGKRPKMPEVVRMLELADYEMVL